MLRKINKSATMHLMISIPEALKLKNIKGMTGTDQNSILLAYAGCLTILYGHLSTIPLFVKLLAFANRATEAAAYMNKKNR